jgi:hypothetical protein
MAKETKVFRACVFIDIETENYRKGKSDAKRTIRLIHKVVKKLMKGGHICRIDDIVSVIETEKLCWNKDIQDRDVKYNSEYKFECERSTVSED